MRLMACAALAGFLLAAGCKDGDKGDAKAPPPERGVAQAAQPGADLSYADDPAMTQAELEKGRMNDDWTSVVQLDTAGGGAAVKNPETWEQISPEQINKGPIFVPLSGDVGGPSVLRVQILLDRVLFSPGMMDGRWGKNTAKAVYFFQRQNGLRPTARVDSATFARLAQAAGSPGELVVQHTLTADDVKGPFVHIPENIQAQAQLDCSCYESLTEKLTEMFHVTPDLLKKLNPGVDLDNLQAGQTVNAPAIRDARAGAGGQVAEIRVSGRGSYVQALDASGKILYHFPSTLGSTYDPSPSGQFKVTSITKDPVWHFQPELIATAADTAHEAMVPKGPNNRVGAVWMALSAPHYGIHGTNKPETIGYATSSGCVRLTNWDALFLADHIHAGIPVHFQDIQGRRGGQAYGDEGMTNSAAPKRSSGAADTAAKSSTRGRSGTGAASRDTTGG